MCALLVSNLKDAFATKKDNSLRHRRNTHTHTERERERERAHRETQKTSNDDTIPVLADQLSN